MYVMNSNLGGGTSGQIQVMQLRALWTSQLSFSRTSTSPACALCPVLHDLGAWNPTSNAKLKNDQECCFTYDFVDCKWMGSYNPTQEHAPASTNLNSCELVKRSCNTKHRLWTGVALFLGKKRSRKPFETRAHTGILVSETTVFLGSTPLKLHNGAQSCRIGLNGWSQFSNGCGI